MMSVTHPQVFRLLRMYLVSWMKKLESAIAAMPQITLSRPTSISMIPANRIQPPPASSYAPAEVADLVLASEGLGRVWTS